MRNDLKEVLIVEKSLNQLSIELHELLIQEGYSKDIKISVFENEEEGVLEIQAITESLEDPLKIYTDRIAFDEFYFFQVDESKVIALRYGDTACYQIVDEKIILKKEEALYEQNN